MKLLDVEAVLSWEANIQQADPKHEILKELDDKTTSYVILSHRWGVEKRDEVRQHASYQKIIKSCKQARKDGYEW
ncbi:hypothetical protein PISMIDRAFT_11306 [Pisolithus microcarpus 441]|uniref:Uncharacterized protein n=1 Tax=Pisolithus microcarpus 441 TaxID=765257 RepID=A0A0C9ZKK3_9AGAM|nr:hypothetical protein BKA83DRAFT_11306 [Pisolithus microcarpus]KIK22947.1 hypothetical protein PISMIDRAFT_11306 [Pisolithus microcarpus 441]